MEDFFFLGGPADSSDNFGFCDVGRSPYRPFIVVSVIDDMYGHGLRNRSSRPVQRAVLFFKKTKTKTYF